MDDEQIGFDIEFDDKTQQFLDWVAPERMESRVQAFLATTVPNMGDDSPWWKPPLSTQVMDAAKELFGDWAGFIAPENRELADGFIRFLGECYIRRHGDITWSKSAKECAPLYPDFGPAVQVRDTHKLDLMFEARDLFRENYGSRMVEYSISKAHRVAW
ncbi:hypothetical protein IU470_31320 [Nocardia abscessus]|uniref:Uncharacterized protein n=1 Tax=Nocardia abscessus TaxID=120957 RepID=A0ABS0CI49_9NOCA|nr:hypothetical protein [Nocardia abscessus]MBF6229565.1 hypothetical protein [Nocardia abscessus]